MYLGYGIFTANTKGSKKFSASYGIKLFTWYAIRPEVKEYFGLKTIEDCPTHSIIYGEKTESGSQLIFEANKTMELNYYDIAYKNTQNMKNFAYIINGELTRNMDAFKKIVKEKGNNLYGIWEWFNFIRRSFWYWIFKRDIKGSHQYFAWLDMCSELVARDNMAHPLPVLNRSLSKINFNVISPADLLNTTYDAIMAKEVVWVNKP